MTRQAIANDVVIRKSFPDSRLSTSNGPSCCLFLVSITVVAEMSLSYSTSRSVRCQQIDCNATLFRPLMDSNWELAIEVFMDQPG